MPPRRYTKPPITEAVIEVRFASAATERDLTRFMRNVATTYPIAERTYDVSAQIRIIADGQQPDVQPSHRLSGYKFTGRDAADLIILGFDRIGTVRLSPYCGWNEFIKTAKINFDKLKSICKYRQIIRIATRYINRIDIPIGQDVLIKTEDYLLLEPRVPSLIPQINNFSTSFVGVVPEIQGQVTIQSGTVISPLIDHSGLLLDIDLFREQNLPQRDAELWSLLEEFHVQKNIIFEVFLTDKARELFDRA